MKGDAAGEEFLRLSIPRLYITGIRLILKARRLALLFRGWVVVVDLRTVNGVLVRNVAAAKRPEIAQLVQRARRFQPFECPFDRDEVYVAVLRTVRKLTDKTEQCVETSALLRFEPREIELDHERRATADGERRMPLEIVHE